jgi:hypothetical protein
MLDLPHIPDLMARALEAAANADDGVTPLELARDNWDADLDDWWEALLRLQVRGDMVGGGYRAVRPGTKFPRSQLEVFFAQEPVYAVNPLR